MTPTHEAFAVKFSSSASRGVGRATSSGRTRRTRARSCRAAATSSSSAIATFPASSSVQSPSSPSRRARRRGRRPTLAIAWARTAWEGIEPTAAGDFAYVGYTAKPDTTEMSFRSYGNSGGNAAVIKLPISALASSTPPTSASATWTQGWTTAMTAKAVRPFATGEVAVMFWTDGGTARARASPYSHPRTAPRYGVRSTWASSMAKARRCRSRIRTST